MKKTSKLLLIIGIIMISISCNSTSKSVENATDSTTVVNANVTVSDSSVNVGDDENKTAQTDAKQQDNKGPKLTIYSFHVTNRCATCKAIEESTRKTLDLYFKNEVKSGQIVLVVMDIDKKENEKIADKFQAFGSSLFVTRLMNGKESIADLTGDGFKYAKNKQDKFIEILKSQILEYLK